ncbi:MAG: DUF2806 domain-containing protein [Chloroflexi bacterium]|nr:DUF2806 domain-containing protein [Chloroflexota bacterium]
MTDNTSLVNIGELAKPATVLVEKISGAIGGVFQPWQIRRVAEAEADAERIKAVTQMEITELQRRALQRFIIEEAKKQNNIEVITARALPQVEANAQPQNIEDDWITNFFDKCRLISDEEMQILWSKVLAGEANSPGTYSKRTVNFLGSLDKSDANLFQNLCKFSWLFDNKELAPLIYDLKDEIYKRHAVNFDSINHFDAIGLLSFSVSASYELIDLPRKIQTSYYGALVDIEFENKSDNRLVTGRVLLSKVGQELAPICGSAPIPEFIDYCLEKWIQKGLIVSSPIRIGKQ